jgi:hypothetical protein
MSTGVPGQHQAPHRSEAPRTSWYGFIAFAAVMLCVLGLFHAIVGLVALFEPDYFVVGESGLLVEVDFSAWGWAHLLLGILVASAGFVLTKGATWARVVAVAAAVVSSMINLAFMSAYPLWSVIMIAIDFLVIYAVMAHGDEGSLRGY